jgi:hypothetical protein
MKLKIADPQSFYVIIRSFIWLGYCLADLIPAWRQKYLVTYESLPIDQAKFERLDKRRKSGSNRL